MGAGQQESTAYNGHFSCTCYHPLFLFNQFGDLERCALRAGNVHSAEGWRDVLEPVVARYRGKSLRRYFRADAAFASFRADAAFASPVVYGFLEVEGYKYAIRLPANRVLQESIGHLLKRPVGRPSSARSGGPTPASDTKPRAGRRSAASSPRSSGIRASSIRASASSSPTWRARPSGSSASPTGAARRSSPSREARPR